MSYKQLFALFICNMIPFIVGNSLMAIMAIYIGDELGAGTTAIGTVISVAFTALAISTMVSARISQLLGHRKNLIRFSSVMCIPTVWLLGHANDIIIFTLVLAAVWFLCGIQIVMTHILTVLNTDQKHMGRAMGVLVAAGSLAQIIGGFLSGQIIATWGYDMLFVFCGAIFVISLIATTAIKEAQAEAKQAEESTGAHAPIGTSLMLLVGASIFAHIATNVLNMTRPLVMDDLNFDLMAITSVVAIGGLVTLPLPLISGWLSDRFGRKLILIVSYLFAAAGAALYLVAGNLWQFQLANALLTVLSCSMVVGTAMIANLVEKKNADTSIALFSATPWIGAVVGSTSAGISLDLIGASSTFWIALILIVLAVVTAMRIQSTQTSRQPGSALAALPFGRQRRRRLA